MAADSNEDVTSGMGRFKTAFDGFWKGSGAGDINGLGSAMLGAPVGTTANILLRAAVLGGRSGTAIAVIGGFELGRSLFIGNR